MNKIISLLICSILSVTHAFSIEFETGIYTIKSSVNPNYVIDLNGSNVYNGSNIHLWERNNTYAQKWYVVNHDDYVSIISMCDTDYAIDLNGCGTYDGNNIHLWERNGTAAQRWRLEPSNGAYIIHSACNYNYVIDLNASEIWNGNNIHCWGDNRTNAQRWYFERVGEIPYAMLAWLLMYYFSVQE